MIVLVLKLCILGSISFINCQSVFYSLNFYFQLNFICVLRETLQCCAWLAPTPPVIGDRKTISFMDEIEPKMQSLRSKTITFIVVGRN
jgi:hypothetical protein